jgi:catechol 2,3-dioxygenase-like lactoylglutathione lyase family enzyme
MPALDHIVLAVPDLDAAAAPFERLGLQVGPRAVRGDRATANRAFFVGDAEREFYLELLAVHDPAAAEASSRTRFLLDALKADRRACAIALAVDHLGPVRSALEELPAACIESQPTRDDGSVLCDLLQPADAGLFGCPVSVLRYLESRSDRAKRHAAAGLFAHELPLKRLDHLAVLVPDPATAQAWTTIFGVPVAGEIGGTGWTAKQMTMDGGTVELMTPSGPDSPMAARPPGLSAMAAFEVDDLADAISLVRGRGFTIADGAPGPIPHTRTATITPDQLSGFAVQLLQYV